jgi:prolyl-tRNA synthetase
MDMPGRKADSKEREKVEVGMTTPKSNFSEWFSEVLAKSELSDLRYNTKGFLVHRPWSVLCMKEMYRLYEQELERRGHLPVWFPAVIPESNFKREAKHVEGFAPELFWITHAGEDKLQERLALRPTSETAMYTMYSLWIRSWRDLPLKLYQSCQVWRCDTKATRPFIRGREFWWIEAHDAFATEKEARQQVIEDMETTEKVMHQEFGIPFIFFRRPEWDKFPGAVHTYAADTLMPDGKALQQPSTHMLGQNFSKSFGITFKDESGKDIHAWQTCYGPAIWRMMSSIVALHGDDKGLRFPFKIAPMQVVIIPIKGVEKEAVKLQKHLMDAGLRVAVDSSDSTPGWKFNQWEMKGVPVRLELGPKELKEGMVTLARRDTGEKMKVKESELARKIPEIGASITRNLVKAADDWFFKGNVRDARDMKSLAAELKKGGFVRIPFCTDAKEGDACAGKVRDDTHADIRGVRADMEEKPTAGAKCIACGKKAGAVVYAARQY